MGVVARYILLLLFIGSTIFIIKTSEKTKDKQINIMCTLIGIILMFSMYVLARIGFI